MGHARRRLSHAGSGIDAASSCTPPPSCPVSRLRLPAPFVSFLHSKVLSTFSELMYHVAALHMLLLTFCFYLPYMYSLNNGAILRMRIQR